MPEDKKHEFFQLHEDHLCQLVQRHDEPRNSQFKAQALRLHELDDMHTEFHPPLSLP